MERYNLHTRRDGRRAGHLQARRAALSRVGGPQSRPFRLKRFIDDSWRFQLVPSVHGRPVVAVPVAVAARVRGPWAVARVAPVVAVVGRETGGPSWAVVPCPVSVVTCHNLTSLRQVLRAVNLLGTSRRVAARSRFDVFSVAVPTSDVEELSVRAQVRGRTTGVMAERLPERLREGGRTTARTCEKTHPNDLENMVERLRSNGQVHKTLKSCYK